MEPPESLLEPLKNTTASVIYYSCLAESKTIPEIAKAWGYKSPAYFYQSRARSVFDELRSKGLIKTEAIGKGREQVVSDYDLLLQLMTTSFFDGVNNRIISELIIEDYNYEITETQLLDPIFREYCLNRKPELKKRCEEIRFSGEQAKILIRLWKNPLFRQIFLSMNCLTAAFDRYELPEDPRELLFGLTTTLCEDIYEFREGKAVSRPPFVYVFFYINTNDFLPRVLDRSDSIANPLNVQRRAKFDVLVAQFKEVYDIVRSKIKVYEEAEEIGSYHISRFVHLMDMGQ